MIQIRCVIEIAGFPKEHIEKTMDTVIKKIKEDNEIRVLKTEVSTTTQIKEIWSTFTEFELEFDNIKGLLDFSFDYTPSLIEIINPERLTLESIELGNFLNDLLARLHQYTMAVTSLNSENKLLKMRLNESNIKDRKTNKK